MTKKLPNLIHLSESEFKFAENMLVDFFGELILAFNEMDPTVLANEENRKSFNIQLAVFFSIHLLGFNKVIEKVFVDSPTVIEQQIAELQKPSEKRILVTFLKKYKIDAVLHSINLLEYVRQVKYKLERGLHNTKLKLSNAIYGEKPVKSIEDELNEAEKILDLIEILVTANKEKIEKLSHELVKYNYALVANAYEAAASFVSNPLSNKCAVVSGGLPPTWTPTFSGLKKLGWYIAYMLQDHNVNTNGYGTMLDSEVNTGDIFVNQSFGMMIFATTIGNYPVLLSGECYHFVNWYADRSVMMNLTLSCITRTIRKNRPQGFNNLFLIMYDCLKPVTKNCAAMDQEISKYYVRFMKTADKIIFNSNAENFGSFFENTYAIKTPRLHFMRYSTEVSDLDQRYDFGPNNDEFHIVSITASFDGYLCTTRYSTHNMVRNILEQGVHFHSYTGEDPELINRFLETVKPEFRKFLHLHPVNRDQNALVKELHRYHAGFNGSDHLSFSEGLMTLKDRKYSDAMFMFMQSTFATSFLVYAAAGLPILVPRYAYAATKYFGKFSIPVCMSEYENIKDYLKRVNLPQLCSEYKELQSKGTITDKLQDLVQFLDLKSNQMQNNKPVQCKIIETECEEV